MKHLNAQHHKASLRYLSSFFASWHNRYLAKLDLDKRYLLAKQQRNQLYLKTGWKIWLQAYHKREIYNHQYIQAEKISQQNLQKTCFQLWLQQLKLKNLEPAGSELLAKFRKLRGVRVWREMTSLRAAERDRAQAYSRRRTSKLLFRVHLFSLSLSLCVCVCVCVCGQPRAWLISELGSE